jgi:hypothetical protein
MTKGIKFPLLSVLELVVVTDTAENRGSSVGTNCVSVSSCSLVRGDANTVAEPPFEVTTVAPSGKPAFTAPGEGRSMADTGTASGVSKTLT